MKIKSGTYAKKHDHSVICDRSGFKAKRSECMKTWDGYLVLKRHHEPRHPQDFVRGVQENLRINDPRPESENNFVASVTEVKASDL